jgi:hypothetical protein
LDEITTYHNIVVTDFTQIIVVIILIAHFVAAPITHIFANLGLVIVVVFGPIHHDPIALLPSVLSGRRRLIKVWPFQPHKK